MRMLLSFLGVLWGWSSEVGGLHVRLTRLQTIILIVSAPKMGPLIFWESSNLLQEPPESLPVERGPPPNLFQDLAPGCSRCFRAGGSGVPGVGV